MSLLFVEVEEQEGDAEDWLLGAAPVTGFSGCRLAAVVPQNSVRVFLSWALKDKCCLVR